MSERILKVNSLIQQELANVLESEIETRDYLITILRVDTSPDLKNCKVWISVLPEKYNGTALTILKGKVVDIKNELSQRLKMRSFPKFTFYIDNIEPQARDVEALLDKIAASHRSTDDQTVDNDPE